MKGFSIGKAIAKSLSHGNTARPKSDLGHTAKKATSKLKRLY